MASATTVKADEAGISVKSSPVRLLMREYYIIVTDIAVWLRSGNRARRDSVKQRVVERSSSTLICDRTPSADAPYMSDHIVACRKEEAGSQSPARGADSPVHADGRVAARCGWHWDLDGRTPRTERNGGRRRVATIDLLALHREWSTPSLGWHARRVASVSPNLHPRLRHKADDAGRAGPGWAGAQSS